MAVITASPINQVSDWKQSSPSQFFAPTSRSCYLCFQRCLKNMKDINLPYQSLIYLFIDWVLGIASTRLQLMTIFSTPKELCYSSAETAIDGSHLLHGQLTF